MKLSILALVAIAQGVRIRDDELTLPNLVDENDVKIDQQLAEIKNEYKNIAKNDDSTIETMEL